MKKLFALLLIAALLVFALSGCTTDEGATKAQGTAVGAGTGAIIGGVIGGILGGGRGVAIGAAIGAATGGVAGYAYGSHVATEKKKYADKEDWYDACIASAKDVNQKTTAYNQTLAKDLTGLKQETAQLAAQYQQKKADKKALAAKKKDIDARLALANEELKRTKWELQNQETVLADAHKSGDDVLAKRLDAEIQALRKNIAELEGHTNELASMSSRMAV